MSAFIVSKAHIDALVATASQGPTDSVPKYNFTWFHDDERQDLRSGENESEIGKMLWEENYRSVDARYSEHEDRDEVYAYSLNIFQCNSKRLTAVQALKAIDCYEYQSCEHREWATSNAKAFCDRLRHDLIGRLPGYEDAAWEITGEAVQA